MWKNLTKCEEVRKLEKELIRLIVMTLIFSKVWLHLTYMILNIGISMMQYIGLNGYINMNQGLHLENVALNVTMMTPVISSLMFIAIVSMGDIPTLEVK